MPFWLALLGHVQADRAINEGGQSLMWDAIRGDFSLFREKDSGHHCLSALNQ